MAKSSKGSAYERQFSKELSLWLSEGEHDDWCWRTSQSGGRATQRAKSGKKTAGAYGDITATCAEAEWFFELMAVELKNGYTAGSPTEVINTPPKKYLLDTFLDQAEKSAVDGNRLFAMLVWKQPRKDVVVFIPRTLYLSLNAKEIVKSYFFVYRDYVCMRWDDLRLLKVPEIWKSWKRK